MTDVATGPGWELRLGRWQDALADVERVDAVITDPPYSPRVHEGQRTGPETAKSTIKYAPLDENMCRSFVERWSRVQPWWVLCFSDHLGSRWWEAAWHAADFYVFSPVIWWRTNATPRFAGDGPTSAVEYITVCRPRRRLPSDRTGSRPGIYPCVQSGATVMIPGGKDPLAMRALVRDYSRRGDLICDPCAGSGTTLLAAVMEGRRAIGSEMDPDTFRLAVDRLHREERRLEQALRQAEMFPTPGPKPRQCGLDLDEER